MAEGLPMERRSRTAPSGKGLVSWVRTGRHPATW